MLGSRHLNIFFCKYNDNWSSDLQIIWKNGNVDVHIPGTKPIGFKELSFNSDVWWFADKCNVIFFWKMKRILDILAGKNESKKSYTYRWY